MDKGRDKEKARIRVGNCAAKIWGPARIPAGNCTAKILGPSVLGEHRRRRARVVDHPPASQNRPARMECAAAATIPGRHPRASWSARDLAAMLRARAGAARARRATARAVRVRASTRADGMADRCSANDRLRTGHLPGTGPAVLSPLSPLAVPLLLNPLNDLRGRDPGSRKAADVPRGPGPRTTGQRPVAAAVRA